METKKYMEVEVDSCLFHLLHVLLDLDNYKFDADIIKLLNELYSLVNEKLWTGLDFENYNTVNEKIIVKYILNK